MFLELIYGKIGSGKFNKCIKSIENTLSSCPEEKNIVIVPEQYSYSAEKRLVKYFGGLGQNRIELLTFSQIFNRYLKKNEKQILPSGKQMLLYRAIRDGEDKMSMFSKSFKKPGFLKETSELISEMKRYLIKPEELREVAKDKEGMLFRKLCEFSDIYERYNALLGDDFIDNDDKFLYFTEFVKSSDEFKDTNIYFAEFVDFLPGHYAVIDAFLKRANSLHITLPYDENADSDGVFEISKKTADSLIFMAEKNNARIVKTNCEEESKRAPEIEHLLKNWDYKNKVYPKKCENICIFASGDLYRETERIARSILKEVKNGRRYRDIGIMCSDMGKYAHLIEAIFSDYNIPYFTDEKLSIKDHSIILTILAAFEISEENWSYESVFKYLRTGFVFQMSEDKVFPLSRDDIDKLENYVLRCGIRGKKEWLSEDDWEEKKGGAFDAVLDEKSFYVEDMERINSIRREVTKPFAKFYDAISGRKTTRQLCEAMYEFLCDINLYEGINSHARRLEKEGKRTEAEMEKEIWNLILEVLDQAVVTLGDEHTKKEDFINMMISGFSEACMQIIPPGLDSVSVMGADKNSPLNFKVGYFLGAVSGTMPKEVLVGGILTDSERKTLASCGIDAAKDNIQKQKQEEFKFYKALSSVYEKIYFSYPVADAEGVRLKGATILSDLEKMFPDITIEADETNENEILNKKQAFLYLMRAVKEKEKSENAKKIIEFYKGDEEFLRLSKMAELADNYRREKAKITPENAKMLYNDRHSYSVSRMSDYAMCPFSYFVKHGLGAREQQIFKIQKFEIGSLLHWAVCEYCKEIEGDAKTFSENLLRWQELSKEQSENIVKKIMDDIKERVLFGKTHNQNKISYLLDRMKKILLRSVEVIRLSLSQGDYTAVCYEEKFSVEIEWNKRKIYLNGTIDRLDAAEYIDEGKISLRVIDYKSGRKDFSVQSISNCNDMQLVVYAIAATELYKKGALGKVKSGLKSSVGGILYNKLKNDMLPLSSADTLDVERKKQMRLDGVLVSDGYDLEIAQRMDKNLSKGAKSSEFLKLSLNSKLDALDSRYSSVMSKDKFLILENFVKKTTVRLDDEIFDGKIDINPLKGKKNDACSYCKFAEICLFEDEKCTARTEISGTDEAWAFMESEITE